MEYLILEAAAVVPFLQISMVLLEEHWYPCWSCPVWKAVVARLSCLPPFDHTQIQYLSGFWLLARSLPLWPCFSLWTWCLFLVYLALTLGFSSKTLAWLLTGSSSEHPECAAFFRVYFLASNKLDQQQAGLTGQWIQWCQKALRNGHVHPGSMRSFELMQNHFP